MRYPFERRPGLVPLWGGESHVDDGCVMETTAGDVENTSARSGYCPCMPFGEVAQRCQVDWPGRCVIGPDLWHTRPTEIAAGATISLQIPVFQPATGSSAPSLSVPVINLRTRSGVMYHLKSVVRQHAAPRKHPPPCSA